MKKKYYAIFAGIIAFGIALGIMYLEFWRDAGVQLPQDVTMQTASGETYDFQSMEPKVRLIEFYYTQCPDVCPLTTQRMMHVRKMLQDEGVYGKDVEFISVSIDPENDTPERISSYMKTFDVESSDEGWIFLRGNLPDTEAFADTFRFRFQDRGTDYIVHDSFTYLIDKENYLVEKFSMGEGFDKDKVFKKIMRNVN
ncbi:SCO family protein [Thalassobacillus hwangdonensis]|uniref:SCO family protein n=1 Tax=Thalassobacillus hwangdonensis TaxID=546108 RepID=A0ABW3KXV6_9BACI